MIACFQVQFYSTVNISEKKKEKLTIAIRGQFSADVGCSSVREISFPALLAIR